ncbi:MAG: potassium channel family protein [Pseudomonadota bacterium]|jgi:voltage-gated potassium channel|nr:potassium channel family protein [Pseudomonadota bacterium]MEC7482985.1 potassium channel family protein [Pseudomonadota bacterium]MEC9062178.1 potassium channel family protein [Pseudomonadota bacterium]MEE3272533.1 potassium channel family protein [Pseudomonadota bacterium]
MSPWIKLRKIMLQYFAESRWYTIVGATAFYAVTSYWLLYAADEHDLITNADFIYWLAVTASTVGYGDLSPVTPAGKLVVALYVIPLGLSIFAMVIGRIAAWVSLTWKKGLLGMNSLILNEHILVIGWNEQRTMLLLDLILQERDAMPERPDIVLCVKADITNPMPGVIEFVKVDSFNKDEDMDRACVSTARTILIDNPQDDVTMTTALYCTKRNPDAHQVAYFDDDSLVSLLQDHCPKVECTPSVAIEMLVKAAFDPGSSMLHHDLLSIEEGQAQFSVKIPESSHAISVAKLFINLKRKHDAIFIGYAPNGLVKEMVVNPPLDVTLNPGDTLFYIAERRINAINWSSLDAD